MAAPASGQVKEDSATAIIGAARLADRTARELSIGGLPTGTAGGQEPAKATGSSRHALLSWQEGVATGALLALAFATDQTVRDFAQDNRSSTTDAIADFGNLFGDKFIVFPALGLGMLGGKLFKKEGLFRAAWHATAAGLLASAGNGILKIVLGRGRPIDFPTDPYHFEPFTFGDNAFASGHTALAFSLATVFAAETKDHVSDVAFFSLASLTGFARINDDKHWMSDVIGGTAIGILAGRWVTGRSRAVVTAAPGGVAVSIPF
jgi:membrane-associated phospholipid phosphatase